MLACHAQPGFKSFICPKRLNQRRHFYRFRAGTKNTKRLHSKLPKFNRSLARPVRRSLIGINALHTGALSQDESAVKHRHTLPYSLPNSLQPSPALPADQTTWQHFAATIPAQETTWLDYPGQKPAYAPGPAQKPAQGPPH